MSHSIKQFKINTNDLRLGMFVSKLDRPWTQTSFPLQGFYLNDPEDIRRLKSVCKHVYIDVAKGKAPVEQGTAKSANGAVVPGSKKGAPHRRIKHFEIRSYNKEIYLPFQPLRKSLKKAEKLHQQIDESVQRIISNLDAESDIKYADIQSATKAIIKGVLTNPDAFVWLNRAHKKDEHTFHHAVRAAILAALYGRHLKLPRNDLFTLVTSMLVKDLGKSQMDAEIVQNNERSPGEDILYKAFVDNSVSILEKIKDLPASVIIAVKSHQEKLDGTGFPRGLRGEKIPLLSQLAHIVTFYDENTNPRGHAPLPPSKAISALYNNIGTAFYDKLVVEFIQAIGLYPTGTLVELKSGELGVVLEQTPKKRLRPKLLILANAQKEPLLAPFEINLGECEAKNQQSKEWEIVGLDASSSEIARDVNPKEYAINYQRIQNEFVFQPKKNKLLSLFS